MSSLSLREELARLEQRREQLLTRRSALAPSANDDAAALQEIERINVELAAVVTKIEEILAILNNWKIADTSSGTVISEDAAAAAENSRVQNPPLPTQIIGPDGRITNASATPPTKSNATRPEITSNATQNENLGIVQGSSVAGGGVNTRGPVQTQSGGAAPSDDARQSTTNAVGTAVGTGDSRPVIAEQFLQNIEATPNLLAKLASMTYTLSIYLMDPEEYGQLLSAQQKSLPNQSLLIQSGGISQSDLQGTGTRNPYFDLDFYIDDLSINNLVAGRAGVGSHTATNLRFTIQEPYGITFLQRLKAAVKAQAGADSNINELSQNFLLVIRFYGYDDQGRLLNGSELGVKEVGSDKNAIVEKWIPFQLTDINYKISSKLTEYNVNAVAVDSNVAFSNIYATIPFNFELSSDTVQDLLNGQTAIAGNDTDTPTNASAPPNASAIPSKKTYSGGLCQALNQAYKELADREGYEIPDQFVIELEDVPGLKDAKVARPGRSDKASGAMNKSQDAADKYLSSKNSVNKNEKNYSIIAGTQIVQLIDMVMRTSSYITSQQNIVFDPKTGDAINQDPVSTVQWFRIRSKSRPLGYDRKRRNYAYEITYIVSRYQINDPRTPYFPNARYRGAHKKYDYWFTGLNTEVLDFNINVNANFFMTIGNDGLSIETPSNAQYIEKRALQARPNETVQPGPGQQGMPAAQLADRIYSPVDVAEVKLDILGDPDWIQQSEIFYKGVDLNPFTLDGSVNYDASEVLFELNFNPADDYDLSTGVMNSRKKNYNSQSVFVPQPQKSVFMAYAVDSYFKQGRFLQTLKGTVIEFDENTGKSAAPTNSTTGPLSGDAWLDQNGLPSAVVPNYEVSSAGSVRDTTVNKSVNGATKSKLLLDPKKIDNDVAEYFKPISRNSFTTAADDDAN